jgi:hypothetical protein
VACPEARLIRDVKRYVFPDPFFEVWNVGIAKVV